MVMNRYIRTQIVEAEKVDGGYIVKDKVSKTEVFISNIDFKKFYREYPEGAYELETTFKIKLKD